MVSDALQADRVRILDERTQHSLAFGQMADPLDEVGGHADVDELLEPAVRADDPEGSVTRTDEVTGSLDDVAEDHWEFEVSSNRPVGPQEAPQPSLRTRHVAGAGDQLDQQLVQRQLRNVRECESGVDVVSALVQYRHDFEHMRAELRRRPDRDVRPLRSGPRPAAVGGRRGESGRTTIWRRAT